LHHMLLIIQFPVADSRLFIDSDTQCLGCPVWQIPNPDIDFVRHFGPIRKRWRGGLSGWVSENLVCEADRALRFRNLLRYSYYENDEREEDILHLPFGVAYRRFYFDGLAVGKFELGMWFDGSRLWDEARSKHVEALFQYFLHIPVRIPNPRGKSIDCLLYEAGKHLASLYLLSSSRTKNFGLQELSSWWVQSCEPILFLLQDDGFGHLDIPFAGRSISLNKYISGDLSHHYIPIDKYTFRLWNFQEKVGPWFVNEEDWDFSRPKYYETKAKTNARELRVFLLRLHAERECLKQILRNIARGRISVSRGTEASDNLQHYLNIATRRIARLRIQGEKLTESDVGELAREAENFVLPGEIESIITTLQNLNIRRNILHKVEEYLHQEVMIIMGDQYNVQQAGAVGPNAQAQNMSFNQIWINSAQNIDLDILAAELASLGARLKEEAKEPEQYTAIGNVMSAEKEARQGNGAKMLEYLSKTGQWVLEMAKSIGVPVAIEALKRAMGLPT
jgi:hypothetical protein